MSIEFLVWGFFFSLLPNHILGQLSMYRLEFQIFRSVVFSTSRLLYKFAFAVCLVFLLWNVLSQGVFYARFPYERNWSVHFVGYAFSESHCFCVQFWPVSRQSALSFWDNNWVLLRSVSAITSSKGLLVFCSPSPNKQLSCAPLFLLFCLAFSFSVRAAIFWELWVSLNPPSY